MVSIGGQVANESAWEAALPDSLPDPWQQGLGLFDLTAMEWKARYDADAAPYITPDPVKAFYQQNGRYPSSWTSSVVQSWFEKNESNSTPSFTPSSTPTRLPAPAMDFSNRTRAIIGGSVGGFAAVVVIFIFAFFFLRRHQHRKQLTDHDGTNKIVAQDIPIEMPAFNRPQEMPQKEVTASELPSYMPAELPSHSMSDH